MPYQNRVDPYGRIQAVADRGSFTGNRGVLHNDAQRLVRTHATKRWIVCRLDFRGARRDVMAPNRWTELFFLDEATALAAGHRPCFFCRHRDAVRFATLWASQHANERARADEIDAVLHVQRRARPRPGVVVARLPAGSMVAVGGRPALVVPAGIRPWSFSGYGQLTPDPGVATLLTPAATVAVIGRGYAPALHSSANTGTDDVDAGYADWPAG